MPASQRRRTFRKNRKHIIVLLLLLIGGAMVNFIVAAVGITLTDFLDKGRVRSLTEAEATRMWESRIGNDFRRSNKMISGMEERYRCARSIVLMEETAESREGLDPPMSESFAHWVKIYQSGWPARSFEDWKEYGNWESLNDWYLKLSLDSISRLEDTIGIDYIYPGVIPLRPIWPGFAINTVFYAVILFALCFGFGQTRRIIRLGRGRCPRCAYPMGTSSVCTECGVKLPGKGRSTM